LNLRPCRSLAQNQKSSLPSATSFLSMLQQNASGGMERKIYFGSFALLNAKAQRRKDGN
jgi:hypothetical protein